MSFTFATKSNNLLKLENMLTKSNILPIFVFTIREWLVNKQSLCKAIYNFSNGKKIIIRSSAKDEDNIEFSNAGKYLSILNINSLDHNEIISSVEEVINSYDNTNNEFEYQEVLVQPMVGNVTLSGVIFSYDIESLGPYYVINYDDVTSNTNTVTGGSNNQKLIKVYREISDLNKVPKPFDKIIDAVKEIEEITDCTNLDVEFAIDKNNILYIFQVRPLSFDLIKKCEEKIVKSEIRKIKNIIESNNIKKRNVYGAKTVYSDMTDWNPAEMIGKKPKPLAYSIYSYIIMDSTWRKARGMIGYYNPINESLMCLFGGHPYVDVRNCFNSYLPNSLGADISNKLIDYYINTLIQFPNYHDKVEFEIVYSSLAFDFDIHQRKLASSGFTNAEINILKHSLLDLTNNIVNDEFQLYKKLDDDISKMILIRDEVNVESVHIKNIPTVIKNLLDVCINFGTIPFSVIVRCAFISTAFLKSLIKIKLLSEQEYFDIISDINPITSSLIDDLEECINDNSLLCLFKEKYGLLRPGTYDITIPSYSESLEEYLDIYCKRPLMKEKFVSSFFTDKRHIIEKKIIENNFNFSTDKLFSFIIYSLANREKYKFEFSKTVSMVLLLIKKYGLHYGLNEDDLSFLTINEFIKLSEKTDSINISEYFRKNIMDNKNKYNMNSFIVLPDLIVGEYDIEVITLQERQPNFITKKIITGEIVNLNNHYSNVNFSNKIVLIENADPGFDWIFTKNIGGLITKYGGAASHMAIRCAEFEIPAAIGCGEVIFNKVINSNNILLNCKEKKIILNNQSY